MFCSSIIFFFRVIPSNCRFFKSDLEHYSNVIFFYFIHTNYQDYILQKQESSFVEVADVCIQCDRLARQDDARVILASQEINLLLQSVESQQQQFSDFCPDQLHLDPAIPITFTKDNRVHIGPKIEMRVVTLGLDGAGKTTILCKLKQGEFVPTIPTIGFNVETLEFKNVKITLWDVGGQHKLRPLWKHYYLNTQVRVIF